MFLLAQGRSGRRLAWANWTKRNERNAKQGEPKGSGEPARKQTTVLLPLICFVWADEIQSIIVKNKVEEIVAFDFGDFSCYYVEIKMP